MNCKIIRRRWKLLPANAEQVIAAKIIIKVASLAKTIFYDSIKAHL
jgi:hypothetical protein